MLVEVVRLLGHGVKKVTALTLVQVVKPQHHLITKTASVNNRPLSSEPQKAPAIIHIILALSECSQRTLESSCSLQC